MRICYDKHTGELYGTGHDAESHYMATAVPNTLVLTSTKCAEDEGFDGELMLEDAATRVAFSVHMNSKPQSAFRERPLRIPELGLD